MHCIGGQNTGTSDITHHAINVYIENIFAADSLVETHAEFKSIFIL